MPVISEGMWPLCHKSWGVQNQLYHKPVSVLFFKLVSHQFCYLQAILQSCWSVILQKQIWAVLLWVLQWFPILWTTWPRHSEPITAHFSLFSLCTHKSPCSSFSKGLGLLPLCLHMNYFVFLVWFCPHLPSQLLLLSPKLSRSHFCRKPSRSPVAV